MTTRPTRPILLAAILAAVLGGCGGDDAAEAAPGGGAPQVYTSEVESVSRWIEQSGAGGDSMELTAAKNPKGEGVVVYARKKGAPAQEAPAAWMVVDSQVVPLNRASRKATPKLPEKSDERTWSRIGISRPEQDEDADLAEVILPEPEAPARPAPRRRAEPAPPAPRPPVAGDPVDSTSRPSRSTESPDTIRIPAAPRTPAQQPPARPAPPSPRPAPGAPASPPRDTIHIPAAAGPGDTTGGPRPETSAPSQPGSSAPQPAPAESTTVRTLPAG